MKREIGSRIKNDKVEFTVWAPFLNSVEVVFKDRKEMLKLQMDEDGYWNGSTNSAKEGTLYKYRLDEKKEFPDPASKFQPEGVHSWSAVVSENFDWKDKQWRGLPISEMIIYELHVGTFTGEGTYEAVLSKIDHLLELGVNTIEILPISQFPGDRNWGYDGVYPFASQDSYGGVVGLKKMIDGCHQNGIAVLLDAVYNHMGPEGNYLSKYGPYFTEKYQTPWGSALNFDDKYSDHSRNFFIQNALMWLEEFHFDGIRLDAIHEIIDRGANHFLRQLSLEVDKLQEKTGKEYVLIAESDLNDTKIINSYKKEGFGLEGQWVDDFHHAVHSLLTSEKDGYYVDYGKMENFAKSFKQAFIYDGEYSKFRKRIVGNDPGSLPSSKFVVCIQNHDQVGNRMLGERLSKLVSFEALKLAAAAMIVSPFVPMLFMGEEYGEDEVFQYFVSHGDPQLVKAVQQGRKREFKYFYDREGDFPDPQSTETFENSKLNWNYSEDEHKTTIFKFYKELISLRKSGAFDLFKTEDIKTEFSEEDRTMVATAGNNNHTLEAFFNFSSSDKKFSYNTKDEPEIILNSSSQKWGGPQKGKEINSEKEIIIAPQSVIITLQ